MLLSIEDLHVDFTTPYGTIHAVRGVSFGVGAGETVAIVGESGSGKSVTALSVMGLLPNHNRKSRGRIVFEGTDIRSLTEAQYRSIRGGTIGMIFQDPMASLNPTMKVGKQIAEGVRRQRGKSRKEAQRIAIEMMERVGIPRAEQRYHQFPHEFSGGQRQRIMIAMALVCKPKLLICDEPTTALDVTIEAQILELLRDLQKETGTSILLITHDLGVVAGMADRVVVMYSGQVVEKAPVEELFASPTHPYTQGLLQSAGSLIPIPGSPPPLSRPIQGCSFAERCTYAMAICKQEPPELIQVGEQQESSCWLNDPRAAQQKIKFDEEEATA